MYLSAISIGYAVPDGNFNASIHSVFQSALNFRLDGESLLHTLTAYGNGDLPQGIQLGTPNNFTFDTFSVGDQVISRDNVLHLGSLTVDIRSARRWKCDLSKLEFDTTNPAVLSAWNCVWDALNERQTLSKAEIIAKCLLHPDDLKPTSISHKAGEAMQNLVNVTKPYDLSHISAVNSLIGLGTGLTPSGDDLLIGYLTGLWCTAQDRSERQQFLSKMRETIIRLSSKTNDISRTYLFHAAQGQVSSQLAHLAKAISHGENPAHLLGAAEAAMQIGHTSGMDAVTGLLIGLETWDGKHILSII